MELYQKLKMLREKHKLTQDELAVKLKVSRSTIANYESGYRVPEINMLHQICDVYNITLDSLFSDKIEYKKSKKHKFLKLIYPLIFSFILSILLIVIVPNVNNETFTYGYDTSNDELKVKNCDEISIIKFKNSIDKNTYEIDIHYTLKGNSFSYITIHNKYIKIDKDHYYLVLGNRISFKDDNNNFATIDHMEIFDHEFIYELNDFDPALSLNDSTTLSGNLINYYSYYINNETTEDVMTLTFENVRNEEVTISSRNPYDNHYDMIDLSKYKEIIKEAKEKNYKYIDIEVYFEIETNKNTKSIVYLCNNKLENSKNIISDYKSNSTYNIYTNIIVNFTSVSIDYYSMEENIYIRYGYSSLFNSSWSNKNLSVKMEFRK